MEPTPAPNPQPRPRPDIDFAPDPYPVPSVSVEFPPIEHQKLVVNPFLAVVALIVWAWLTRRLFFTAFPPSALLPCLIFGLVPILIHTHCLDCGATEIYPRWRQHACPKVLLRSRSNRPSWFTWPTARTQLIIWGYILGSVTLLLAVVGFGMSLLRRR